MKRGDNENYESLLKESFLKTLSKQQLDTVLEVVLRELRSRDSDALKEELLTRSQMLRRRKNKDQ